MYKTRVLAIGTIIIGVLFAFSSCEQSTSTTFEESFQSVKQVTPLIGAQNTKMDLQLGDQNDSFFTVSLNDGSAKEAWCIEWNEDASFGLNEGTELFSTKGQDAWKELNYFMAIKDDLKAQDPELTYKEIQVVIWSLIDKPSFDVDKISTYENISERIYKDGQPQFDVQKVKDIVNDVHQYFEENKNKSWFWWWNYFLVFIQNDGQTVMVESETAYAYGGEPLAKCFIDEVPNLSSNKWGWTNGPLTEGEYEFDMYAGAGQCDINKGTLVGKLIVDYSGGTAVVTYRMTETSDFTDELYTLIATQLHIGNDLLPTKKNGSYTAAPGQYGYVDTDHEDITEFTYTVNGLSGDIYIAAHADVNGFEGSEED